MGGPFVGSDFKLFWADDVDGTVPLQTAFIANEITLEASSVTNSGGDRTTGSVSVSTRALPYVGVGKKQPMTLSMKLIFQTAATDFLKVMKPKFDAATKMWFLIVPYVEGTLTDTGIVYGVGYITNLKAPDVDSASGDPMVVDCDFYNDGWDTFVYDGT